MVQIIGSRYWRLEIIWEWEPIIKPYRPKWYRTAICKCDCWNTKTILLNDLRKKSNHTNSCGCIVKETMSKKMAWNTIWVWRKHSEESKKRIWDWHRKNFGWENILNIIRDCQMYNEWRKAVYARDNFTCVITDIPWKGNLECHHLLSLTSIVEKNNITTIQEALECDELWDINNWVTLIDKIHNKFHAEYGFGFNTPEQFEEFKEGFD